MNNDIKQVIDAVKLISDRLIKEMNWFVKEINQIAATSLEKQIPLEIKEEAYTDTKCKCGHIFSRHCGDGHYIIPHKNRTNYCPECGQRLKWKEDDDGRCWMGGCEEVETSVSNLDTENDRIGQEREKE